MDLHVGKARATAAEQQAVDAVLGPPASGWEGGERRAGVDGHAATGGHLSRQRRHLLLPALQAAQARRGFISEGALNYICLRLTVPPAEAYGVATFYSLLSLAPRPPVVAHVCDDIACRLSGAEALCAELTRTLGPAGGEGRATWLRSPCLGQCERAPAVLVTRAGERPLETALGPATGAQVLAALADGPARAAVPSVRLPQFGDPGLRLLRRIGRVDPTSCDDYRAHGGYAALRRAIELGPEGVIREVLDSRLVGRGGAAFPTGRKWEAVSRAVVRPHYLVCNADESEPGTFKDRVLMEEDPFAVLEAMTIAGYATGCEIAYLYVRGEYPLAAERLQGAILEARGRGLLGQDVMGHGFRFEVEVRRGAGAYICGEETALFNSIEGFRGEPRNKPPFPTQAGLFGKPTVVNNVETLANVLEVLREGGPAFASVGTAASTGTKLFCLSGHVKRPGLYEVPFGTTLRALLDLAGGVAGGRALRTVLLGGAAGAFVTPAELDVPLTFEGTRAIGASLGSGVVLALDDTTDLWDIVRRIAAFFRDESCGQCVPCRVGTVRQEELLARLARGGAARPASEELLLLSEIGQAMRDASICGLGQTASAAVQSALAKLGLIEGGRT
ncbi:MAG TPA: NAD(P)H-dependent oxidoreductase subunit E [Candidatus Polarisedimenticolia bacterium]|nr:NAD(P)H-dependent oxidoreductase subunit E [Candidatus Polarisedimenticolia bacterium]